jgi:hypothetical protein
MMNKALVAAGLTLALSGVAWADTPIGPGVTGSGGTGANAADANVRAGAAGDAKKTREDGMPVDRADANVRNEARAKGASGGKPIGNESASGASGTRGGLGAVGNTGGVQIKPEAAIDP